MSLRPYIEGYLPTNREKIGSCIEGKGPIYSYVRQLVNAVSSLRPRGTRHDSSLLSVCLSVSPSLTPSLLSLTSHATLLARADDVQTNLWHEENRRNSLIHSRTDGERTTNEGTRASGKASVRRVPNRHLARRRPLPGGDARSLLSVGLGRRTENKVTREREREGEREKSADADEMRGPPRLPPCASLPLSA